MTLEAVQGARRPSLQLTWADETGTAVDLTGATITGVIENQETGESRAITGSFVLVTAASGVFRWDYSAADVEETGVFFVQFTADYAVGQTPAKSRRSEWRVLGSIAVA